MACFQSGKGIVIGICTNVVWSLDFVADQLVDGHSLRRKYVVAVLNQIAKHRGTQKKLLCNNGSEFTSQIMDLRAYQPQVQMDFSRPGKSTDNAYIESFNGILRRECLNAQWFMSMEDAQQQLVAWRQEYNVSRPHRAMQNQTPTEFARKQADNESVVDNQPAGTLT